MSHIDEKQADRVEVKKAFLQLPNMRIADLPLHPRLDSFVTDNFIKPSFAYMLIYDATAKRWITAKADSSGNIKTTASVTNNIFGSRSGVAQAISANILGGLFIDPSGRDLTVDAVMDNLSIPAGGSATHDGLNMQHAAAITVLVSTNNNTTIRPQISDDNVNWYDIVNESDTLITFAVNNVKKALRLSGAAKYLRLFVTNNAAAAVNVTMKVLGQA